MRSDQEKTIDIAKDGEYQAEKANILRQELRALCRLLSKVERQHDQDGATLPTSYTQAVVVLLDYHTQDKTPTLSDLVDLLDIDKSNVTRLCQRMEQAGYIELKRDDRDRRSKRIHLTDDGVDFARQVNQESLDLFSRIVDQFPDEQQERLLELLARLNQIIRQHA